MQPFPDDFTWGVATAAYQIEGGHEADGKGPSIWDAFCRIPGRVARGETGDVACDHYHRFREDIAVMKELRIPAYRLSISWPRVLPSGRLADGGVNEAGVRFYSELIDALLEAGITPWVTLYHWDLPLALQTERDGWLNPDIAQDFADYARLCFDRFGDRVRHWITLNEPWVVAILGYGHGVFAPGRKSRSEPYVAAHHLLRAHAQAVAVYRNEFSHQRGRIGIANNCDWREPRTDKPQDIAAAERALDFYIGWFADPIFGHGDYPATMRERVAGRLPHFTDAEHESLRGSSDFFGLNTYTTMFAAAATGAEPPQDVHGNGGISEDQEVVLSVDPAWEKTDYHWAVVPWGCRKLLEYLDHRYDHPSIVITENGCAYDDPVRPDGNIHDNRRIRFHQRYLVACAEAVARGVNLCGYFAWSLMDNMEWAKGYELRFGLVHIDRQTLARTPKASARWYSECIASNGSPHLLLSP
jgi:beta-galactosidase